MELYILGIRRCARSVLKRFHLLDDTTLFLLAHWEQSISPIFRYLPSFILETSTNTTNYTTIALKLSSLSFVKMVLTPLRTCLSSSSRWCYARNRSALTVPVW